MKEYEQFALEYQRYINESILDEYAHGLVKGYEDGFLKARELCAEQAKKMGPYWEDKVLAVGEKVIDP